jgi:hypothetical protein
MRVGSRRYAGPVMATSAAIRQRRHREYERANATPVQIVVTELVADALEQAGFIDLEQLDDKAALARAIQALLHDWAVRVTA